MAIKNALASLAVSDLKSSIEWYEQLFGRPADSVPMSEVAEWKFERGGWLQVYQSKNNTGTGSVTLAVDNVEQQIAALKKLDIDPGQEMGGDKVKIIMIKDPDGNSIAFAEALDVNIAQ